MTSTGIVLLIASLTPIQQTSPSGYPPIPTFRKHIDYIAWYEKACEEGPAKKTTNIFGTPQNTPRRPGTRTPYQVCTRWLPGMPGSKIDPAWWPKFDGPFTSTLDKSGEPHATITLWDPAQNENWESSVNRTAEALQNYANLANQSPLSVPTGLNDAADDDTNRLCRMNRDYLRYLNQCAIGTLERGWRMDTKRPDPRTLLAAFETNLRIAKSLEHSLGAAEHRTARRIRRITYEHIRRAFSQRALRTIHARTLAETLRAVDADPVPFAATLPGETAVLFDRLQYVYGSPQGEASKIQLDKKRFKAMTGKVPPAEGTALGDSVREDPVVTAEEIANKLSIAERILTRSFDRRSLDTLASLATEIEEHSPITQQLFAGFAKRLQADHADALRCETLRRGTHLLVEILAYHHKHGGRWPKKLSTFSRELRQAIGDDPFSGTLFIYRISGDEPLLYSVATNGRDDGGLHDPNWGQTTPAGDFVFWPVPEQSLPTTSAPDTANIVPLADITPELKGKTITVIANVVELTDDTGNARRKRFVLTLSEGEHTIDLIFYGGLWDSDRNIRNLRPGTRIRAEATVEKAAGRLRLKLTDVDNLIVLD